eukprot:CAMPEP_0179973972 /NCGR_PEP_ID=MMETSP0983-20121128/37752_1 /TAXON_ID=483367 /ORGANISM="non described non described, Strain CCMP 2436" /LENGTH=56 /DNA_ID=CAMNT_0021890011 /DNA_START=71 /DNA_END=237 /DNA_ORIENTATION=-
MWCYAGLSHAEIKGVFEQLQYLRGALCAPHQRLEFLCRVGRSGAERHLISPVLPVP